MRTASPRRLTGFTLVELLVVIGIIALLISILLPALNKARESARQVKCLSNMQQIAKAVMMFADANKGKMPTAAGTGTPLTINSSGNFVAPATNPPTKDDLQSTSNWIAWRRTKDAVIDLTATSPLDMNITYSSLTKYLGGKLVDTTGDSYSANNASRNLEELFRCPSDVLETRPKTAKDNNGNRGAYRYSYSYNRQWSGDWINTTAKMTQGVRGEECSNGVTTSTSLFTGKIGSIRKAGDKILLVCEDEQTLDDDLWTTDGISGGYNSTTNWVQNATIGAVAARHENKRRNANSSTNGTSSNNGVGTVDARGNVAFCDGHAAFISRREALYQSHTGNKLPDDPLVYTTRRLN